MGRFFSNIQIQNNQNENREQFAKSFCKSMEKKGYISSTEDDSSLTYVLAFSENNKWITLCSADYESGGEDVKKDVQFLAESLKTCCISTSVVDSDFAILEMYNAASTLTDMVLVGDGSGYGFEDDTEFKGKKEAWEPYLTSGSTWGQLSKIWNGDYVFTEEALSKMAPVLGMDSQNIISDYDDLSSRTDENIVVLHLKKKDKKKALSLNAAFIQVFGEALEPLGFVKLKKVKHPYFVRLIGDEILHIVTYRKVRSIKRGYNSFEILGGIVTLYRRHIDFSDVQNFQLKTNLDFYRNSNLELDEEIMESAIRFECEVWEKSRDWFVAVESFNGAFRRSIVSFLCKSDDSVEGVKNAFNVTKHVMLQVFDKVTQLNEYIDYVYKFNAGRLRLCDFEEFITSDCYSSSEGLLLIKANYRDDGIERMERKLAMEAKESKYNQKEIEAKRNARNNYRLEQMAVRNKMLDDPELNADVLSELERCKVNNIEVLRSYGVKT